MKLWILTPVDTEGIAWRPWYDKNFGFVIRAKSEPEARKWADEAGGDENRGDRHPWLDPMQSKCEELQKRGEPGILMSDFHAA